MSLSGPHFLRGLEGLGLKSVEGDLFRVRPDSSQDSILVTLGRQVAAQFNVADTSGLTRSWFAPSFLPATSAVAWDVSSQQYTTVLGHTNLLLWNGEETKLEKVEQHKLKTKVSDVLTDNITGEVYLAFQSGHVQSISYIQTHLTFEGEELILPSGATLIRTHLMTHAGNQYIIHHFVNGDKKSKSFGTFRLKVDPDCGATTLQEVTIVQEQKERRSLGVVLTTDGPASIVIDATDSSLLCIPLLGKGAMEYQIARMDEVKLNDRLSVASCDADFLGIVGEQKKCSDSLFCMASLKFATIVASISITGLVDAGLLASRNRFLIRVSGRVAQIGVSSMPKSLDSMMGLVASRTTGKKDTSDLELISRAAEEKVQYLGEMTSAMLLYEKLPELFRKQDLAAIEQMLDMEPDMPELLVLSVIEFLFLLPDTKFAAPKAQVQQERLLSKAFQISITEPLMVQYLGQVEFGVILKMLQFLDIALKLEPGEQTDAFAAYIGWTSLLLNAHYSNILITKDEATIEVLKGLTETVSSFEKNSVSFASLMPLVKLIKDKKIETTSLANNAYCIEIVNL